MFLLTLLMVLRIHVCCRMMSDYSVETINDGISEFNVEFHGPKESNVTESFIFQMDSLVIIGLVIVHFICVNRF